MIPTDCSGDAESRQGGGEVGNLDENSHMWYTNLVWLMAQTGA